MNLHFELHLTDYVADVHEYHCHRGIITGISALLLNRAGVQAACILQVCVMIFTIPTGVELVSKQLPCCMSVTDVHALCRCCVVL